MHLDIDLRLLCQLHCRSSFSARGQFIAFITYIQTGVTAMILFVEMVMVSLT